MDAAAPRSYLPRIADRRRPPELGSRMPEAGSPTAHRRPAVRPAPDRFADTPSLEVLAVRDPKPQHVHLWRVDGEPRQGKGRRRDGRHAGEAGLARAALGTGPDVVAEVVSTRLGSG